MPALPILSIYAIACRDIVYIYPVRADQRPSWEMLLDVVLRNGTPPFARNVS